MSTPQIHGPNFSTYARSVRLALEEKGVAYELHEVNILTGAHTEPEHLARNPFGKVPTFTHDGLTIYETSAILRYIDRAFPGVALQAADPKVLARGDMVMSILDSFAYGSIIGKLVTQRMLMPMLGGAADEAVIEQSLDQVKLCLAEFNRLLGHGDWFGGTDVGLADLLLAPVFAYMMGTAEGREMMAGHPHLGAWFERIAARPSMKATEPVFG
jgi:glutathione S-transferase